MYAPLHWGVPNGRALSPQHTNCAITALIWYAAGKVRAHLERPSASARSSETPQGKCALIWNAPGWTDLGGILQKAAFPHIPCILLPKQ